MSDNRQASKGQDAEHAANVFRCKAVFALVLGCAFFFMWNAIMDIAECASLVWYWEMVAYPVLRNMATGILLGLLPCVIVFGFNKADKKEQQ